MGLRGSWMPWRARCRFLILIFLLTSKWGDCNSVVLGCAASSHLGFNMKYLTLHVQFLWLKIMAGGGIAYKSKASLPFKAGVTRTQNLELRSLIRRVCNRNLSGCLFFQQRGKEGEKLTVRTWILCIWKKKITALGLQGCYKWKQEAYWRKTCLWHEVFFSECIMFWGQKPISRSEIKAAISEVR